MLNVIIHLKEEKKEIKLGSMSIVGVDKTTTIDIEPIIVGRKLEKYKNKELHKLQFLIYSWLRGQDSNLRPLGYEPNELPTAPPRDVLI